jgi:hypothetical protein
MTTVLNATSSRPRFRRFTKASRSTGKNDAQRIARKSARQNRRGPPSECATRKPNICFPRVRPVDHHPPVKYTTRRIQIKSSFNQCGGAATEIESEKKRSHAMLTRITPTTYAQTTRTTSVPLATAREMKPARRPWSCRHCSLRISRCRLTRSPQVSYPPVEQYRSTGPSGPAVPCVGESCRPGGRSTDPWP